MKIIQFLIALVVLNAACTRQSTLEISAPNGALSIVLNKQGKDLEYQLFEKDLSLISASSLSILPGMDVTILDTKIQQINETWNPLWGQFSEIQDHYNELEVALDYEGIPATLYVRAYNQGVAFRFEVLNIPEDLKPSFLIEYTLPDAAQLYSPTSGVKEAIGPLSIGALSQMDSIHYDLKMPLVVQGGQNQFLSLLESDLISTSGFKVIDFKFDPKEDKLIAKNDFKADQKDLRTPWRLILVEDQIGNLLTNTVPLNVAAPNQIENPSWIKPGKTLWDWRVHGYQAPDGFTYGINNESYFRFIDFAAANDIEYFMIDDGWYTHVEPGHMEMSEKLDLRKVTDYAKTKGVSLLLYYDRREGDYGDEALFPYYQSLGMKGIKYGFMGDNVLFTKSAIQRSAESHLLIDFHDGPVPFTGVSRTYPNAITKEFCHAQQDYRRAFTPKNFIRMALLNGIQGPLDMNNGIFDITGVNAGQRQKGPKQLNSLRTTVTAEAARTLIIFSGLVCIPDAPEAYTAKQDLFEFIQKMPVGKWDETKVLHAQMDKYISTARRHGEAWFIGSVHHQGGDLDIALDFLKENQNYKITYYEDTEETNSETNPEAYRVHTAKIKKGDVVKATMVAGSGHCMWIRPE